MVGLIPEGLWRALDRGRFLLLNWGFQAVPHSECHDLPVASYA